MVAVCRRQNRKDYFQNQFRFCQTSKVDVDFDVFSKIMLVACIVFDFASNFCYNAKQWTQSEGSDELTLKLEMQRFGVCCVSNRVSKPCISTNFLQQTEAQSHVKAC